MSSITGEPEIIDIKKGTLFDKLFLKTRSGKAPLVNKEVILKKGNNDNKKNPHPLYDKSFDPEKMIALQNKKGQGIDLICKIDPPPPDWVTFEIKTVMKDKYGANSTPTGGKASDFQEDYIGNIKKHIQFSRDSVLKGINEYKLDIKKRILLNKIKNDIKKGSIGGFKLTVGIDSKFDISSNKKYDSFYIIEDLSK